MMCSFLCSYECTGGKFVEFEHGAGVQIHFGCAGRRLEHKSVCIRYRVCLPVLDPQGVLRSTSQRLARDDVFAGYWRRAGLDPYLLVCIDAAKREMLAFDSVDDALADMFGVDDIRHQFIVGIGQQQIGAGHCGARLRLECIDY
jgi:hypothetical protein